MQHDSADEGLLLWALLDVVVDRYFAVTDMIDDRLDSAEAYVLDDSSDAGATARNARPRQLFDLSKTIVEFRRNAAPLREVVAAILRRETSRIDDAALVHFQDLGDHVLRVSELLEAQRDVLTNLRDAELAVVSNRMNRSMQQARGLGRDPHHRNAGHGSPGHELPQRTRARLARRIPARWRHHGRSSRCRCSCTSAASAGSDAGPPRDPPLRRASAGCAPPSSVRATASCRPRAS